MFRITSREFPRVFRDSNKMVTPGTCWCTGHDILSKRCYCPHDLCHSTKKNALVLPPTTWLHLHAVMLYTYCDDQYTWYFFFSAQPHQVCLKIGFLNAKKPCRYTTLRTLFGHWPRWNYSLTTRLLIEPTSTLLSLLKILLVRKEGRPIITFSKEKKN